MRGCRVSMAHALCCGHGDKLSTEHQDVSTTAACPAPSIRRVKLVYAMSHVSSVRDRTSYPSSMWRPVVQRKVPNFRRSGEHVVVAAAHTRVLPIRWIADHTAVHLSGRTR